MKLAITKRDVFWKKTSVLKKQSLIPCVVYWKHMTESFYGVIAKNEFIKTFREVGTSTVIDLTGDSKELVLVHAIQRNPVKDELIHVDFLAVNADEKVTAEVHIVIEWAAPLEAQKLWKIEVVRDHVKVEALPRDLPHHITIDISSIAWLDDGIFVKNLDLWSKVKVLDDADLPLVVAVEIADEAEEVASPSTPVA